MKDVIHVVPNSSCMKVHMGAGMNYRFAPSTIIKALYLKFSNHVKSKTVPKIGCVSLTDNEPFMYYIEAIHFRGNVYSLYRHYPSSNNAFTEGICYSINIASTV